MKPPLSYMRIACELVVGGIAGIIGVVITSAILTSIYSTGQREDWGALIALYVLILIGPIIYMILSSIAVYLCGSVRNQTGSLTATLIGALLGGIVGILCIFVWWVSGKASIISYLPVAIPGFLPSPIGATIAFNLTRRYKAPVANQN